MSDGCVGSIILNITIVKRETFAMLGGTLAKRKARKPKIMLLQRADLIHDRKAQSPTLNTPVATLVVDDPYAVNPGERIEVVRSLRDDPLAGLHASGQIKPHQYEAGRHLQRAYELAEIGGVRAIDPTKEAVDGGGIYQTGITDAQMKAFKDIEASRRTLGHEGTMIVEDILVRHFSIAQTAVKRGLSTQRERDYIGRRFRECLDTLAQLFGHVTVRAYPQSTS